MDKGGVGALTLSDVISIHREIGVFIDTLLSVDEAGSRLEDGAQNTTVLAPTNTVMRHLSRKPWQDPRDAEEADTQGVSQDDLYAGDAGEDRASQNLRRFVQAHLVEVSPWQKGKENMAKTLGGKSVWWDEEGGVRKIYPDGIEVEEVKDERSNGQIWVIKGVMNY
ncbi:FAS1 domain-containing protein [Kalaharituber pfeilii]|nr:FAS1 domain-containing protein [Kalaharituber pfeilii]